MKENGKISAYWGIQDNSHRILARHARVMGNLKELINNKYYIPFDRIYVWGDENVGFLKQIGFKNVVKVSKEPFQWDLVKQQYRHKLEAIRMAHTEFNCVLQLDMDVLPIRQFNPNIWNLMGQKEVFQANLYYYKKAKNWWRISDQRKVTNGGCTYTRGPQPIEEIIKIWERKDMRDKKTVEPSMSRYCDELIGGWKDIDKYRQLFEIDCCVLRRNSPYGKYDTLITKDTLYIHHAGLGRCRNEYME